ncbi:MAG: MFS transporter [Kofleriaceae bacterium]
MRTPIIALAIAAFAIGTTEFVIIGLLPDVATDLEVSLASAGFLVTGYALGVAVGAPVIAVLTKSWPTRASLLSLMAVFVAGNVVSACAPTYGILLGGRVLASFAHGSFFGRGAVVASSLVPPSKRAVAISLMFTGLTLANVLGVPLGTLVGHVFGWRATFWCVAGFGTIALVAVAALVPSVATPAEGGWGGLANRRVGIALLLTTFGFGGTFVAFTFITPMLASALDLSPTAITIVLFLFGIGVTLGNALGGHLATHLGRVLAALAIIELVLALVLPIAIVGELFVVLWGVAAFATVPVLQLRVVEAAREAPTIASTLNIAAFNIGNAGGAALGAILVAHEVPLRALPVASAVIAAIALGLSAI